MSDPNMGDKYVTLATQCMDFCRHLDSKGKAYKFSITIGSDFTFSLDTRGEATTSREVRKKLSPSSVKRNARRKEEFLKKKSTSSEETVASSEKKSVTPEKAVKTTVELEQPAENQPGKEQPAEKEPVEKQPASQPWRRPSTCRRCGLNTKGHPGPYGEGRCRVSLPELPNKIRVEKCSDCFDHPSPPCDAHRKPWAGDSS